MANFIDTHARSGAFVAIVLRRLIDVIAAQGDDLLDDAGIIIPSRAVSCILLVGDRQEVSAADIAKALQQPHQLATQRIELLIDLGLLERRVDPKDRRRKTLRLTSLGTDQFQRLLRRLAEVEQAFASLFEDINHDLPKIIDRAIGALGERSLLDRISDKDKTESHST